MVFSKFKQILILAMVTLSLTACSALQISETDQKRIALQYATLKVINQSGDITAEGVLGVTTDIREALETDLDVDLRDLIGMVPVNHLDPEEQILVSALFQQIRYSMEDLPVAEVPDNFKSRASVVLDWIEEAARLAQ